MSFIPRGSTDLLKDGLMMNRIVINDVRDIDLEHVFECGQCFRWVPAGDGSGDYIRSSREVCSKDKP